MLDLSRITLFCVETRAPHLALFAIEKCTQFAKFGKVILATNPDLQFFSPDHITRIATPPITSTEAYSEYLLSDLTKHFLGTHVLIIQWDSFILDPKQWSDEFLNYDYIGAPWPHHPNTPVGNGGFSLRSTKLWEILAQLPMQKKHPEDQAICIFNRYKLENDFDIQFAPIEVARQFAFERGKMQTTFGFHGLFNFDLALPSSELLSVLSSIPKIFLGGQDTYELIGCLMSSRKFSAAELLLKSSKPKGKYWKWHLKLWLKCAFNRYF
jgi:hypothetical protein